MDFQSIALPAELRHRSSRRSVQGPLRCEGRKDKDPSDPMNAPLLILDAGNTRTKAALFRDGLLRRQAAPASRDAGAVKAFLDGVVPAAIGVGSVAQEDPALVTVLRTIAPVHVLTGASPSPFPSRLPDRSTLGVDRLANAVGAARTMPGRATLVIDPGTAITYDVVEPDGTHAGGAISPGRSMRARA